MQRVSLDDIQPPARDEPVGGRDETTLIALDTALKRLADHSERQSRIVECRFFGGMTVKQTAHALGLSAATVNRGWSLAQAWLYRELQGVCGTKARGA